MSIRYQIWLTYNAEKEKIQLPVHPDSFKVKNGSNNDSVNVSGLGEITVIQSRPALQFSFSSFFPAEKFPGIQVDRITEPLALVQKINSWKEGKKPVHFIITACGVNIYTTIEDFTYSEEGGDPGTYHYSISLKEYREIAVRQVQVDIQKATALVKKGTSRVDNSVKPMTYTARQGDNLFNLSKKFYGDGGEHKKIYEANRGTIGGNPNMVRQGQVLTMP